MSSAFRRVAGLLVFAVVTPLLVVSVPAPVSGAGQVLGPVLGSVEAVQTADTRSDHVVGARGVHTWRTTERLVPVRTGPDDDIAIDLDTRLYVPRNATRKTPQPAILMTHGFGLTKDSNEVVSTAEFFAAHGYVVLAYTASGFGASGGCVTLHSADYDVKSAAQLIDRVLEPRADVLHDRHGAVVGTIGGSYGGGIQLPLAAADKRIHATVLGRTWNNLAYSLDPNNYIVPGDPTGLSHTLNQQGVFKQEWTSLFYAVGNTQPAMGGGGCPQAKAAAGDPTEVANAGSCPGFYFAVCRIYDLLTSAGTTDAEGRRYIARASASTYLKQINAPTLLVQGQSDTLFNVNDAASTFLALKRRDVPVGMIWNSGGHGGYNSQPGECEAYDGVRRTVAQMDKCYLPLRSLRWMNAWLRGRTGRAQLGLRGPEFTYYRDWVPYGGSGADDEQYGVGRFTFNRGGTVLTLSGSDALVAAGKPVTPGSATLLNPAGGAPGAYSETSNFSGPDASPSSQDLPPTEQPGQFAAFTSAPFASPRVSVGIPTAHVRISNTNGQDLVFFAKVYDVAPDGSETLIHRLIAPVRVPADAVGTPVDFALAGFAHRFDAGHSVRLVLCTTDLTSYNAKVADVLTVTTGAGSTFRLP